MLRHFAASDIYRNGMDVVAIQEMLGHEWINTMMIYVKPRELHRAEEKPQVSRSRRVGIAICASGQRPSDRIHCLAMVFDAIMVRRTAAPQSEQPLDLGSLAEAMLFYRTVRLILTRWSICQLVRQCGADMALEIVLNTNVDAIRVDQDMTVCSQDLGTAQERHWPLAIKTVETDEAMVVRLFREATGRSGKGRRQAEKFLASTRAYALPINHLTEAVGWDWQDRGFMGEAAAEVIAQFAPSYAFPTDVDMALIRRDDGSYAFRASSGSAAFRRSYATGQGASQVSIGHLLSYIAEMREDLYLSAEFGTGMAQDPLGTRLTQAKCCDLTRVLDGQQSRIDQFVEVVVHGVNDLRGAVNSGACSFASFLCILKDAEEFRSWLDTQSPDSDLVKEYFREVTKKRMISSTVVKELRWLIPVAAGFALFLPNAAVVAPSAAAGLAAVDRFLVSRFTEGWRPAIFIDSKLRPLMSH